jgi:hypothetical protein
MTTRDDGGSMKDFLVEIKYTNIHMGDTNPFKKIEFVQLVRGETFEDARLKMKKEIEENNRVVPGSIRITNLTME